MARQKNQLGRAIAITGGGALVVWLLCRGRGGRASDGDAAGGGHAAESPAPTSGGHVAGSPAPTSGGRAAAAPVPTSVRVVVLPGDRVQVDGVDTDLHTLSERARAVRRALVDMRPGVREAWAIRVVEQLRATGVDVQFG